MSTHNIYAASWQNQHNELCAQRRLRSTWASAQSDQSSLSEWRNIGSSATHWAHCEDSDQTGQMPRLIWVFSGVTYHFVGFIMRQLICFHGEILKIIPKLSSNIHSMCLCDTFSKTDLKLLWSYLNFCYWSEVQITRTVLKLINKKDWNSTF